MPRVTRMQVVAELWAAEASKAAAVSAAQLRYTRLAARLRTMQASANQRVRSSPLDPEGSARSGARKACR